MKESFSKKAVGERLKGFRLSMHMTQKEFAEEMHWDVNTYRKIETGCSLLTSDKAQMLYDKYEIDITYLLTGNKPDFDKSFAAALAYGKSCGEKTYSCPTYFLC